jgi:hypothetical protein
MTAASLLSFLSAALSFVALAFLVTGLGRTIRLTTRPFGRRKPAEAMEYDRLRIAQFADWGCAAGLVGAAVVALAVGRLGTGPAFNEPSGNAAGGFVLITAIVVAAVLLTLSFRHVIVSRALRKLRAGKYADPHE